MALRPKSLNLGLGTHIVYWESVVERAKISLLFFIELVVSFVYPGQVIRRLGTIGAKKTLAFAI